MKFDPSGGYRRLDSWVMACIVQFANFRFCEKFVTRTIDPTGRQYDQMTQAARSGKVNIVEGSARASTSKETEMKLTAIRTEARALEENAPVCPECGKPMKRRTAKAGSNAGHDFWGCTGYPACKGVRKIERPESTGTTGGENTANR